MQFEDYLKESLGPGHRFAVTLSEPDHPMVSKRKEKMARHINVRHETNQEKAKAKAEKHYTKLGFKVHDIEHHSVLK